MSTFLPSLTRDNILNIVYHLNVEDIGSMSRTCKILHQNLNSHEIWTSLVKRDFADAPTMGTDPKEYYKELHQFFQWRCDSAEKTTVDEKRRKISGVAANWDFICSKEFRNQKIQLMEFRINTSGGSGTLGVGVTYADFDLHRANNTIKNWTSFEESWSHCSNGYCLLYGTHRSTSLSYTNGDIVAVLVDLEQNKVYFFKNNTLLSVMEMVIRRKGECSKGEGSKCFILGGCTYDITVNLTFASRIDHYLEIINNHVDIELW
eukprot:TRINITY_DN15703_c0_g1_i1.p1 TRINITY_DN15703_c0_g1~~TRINITY_DN15703_c0_g1_i1.p1  ORF type:complete len:276 (-),score=52.62 TRINITY_DN15703_c0_g1_i1:64-849(-)